MLIREKNIYGGKVVMIFKKKNRWNDVMTFGKRR